jgi:hypothetical protein
MYKEKYLKYKIKYTALKNQLGGEIHPIQMEPYTIPDIPKILNYNNTSPYRYEQIEVRDEKGNIEYMTTKNATGEIIYMTKADGNRIPKRVWVKKESV